MRSAVALLAALWLLCAPAPGQERRVRVVLEPAERAFVGQRVRVNVDVLTPETLFATPRLDLPVVDAGVLLFESTQAVRFEERVGGARTQVTRFALALFAHRPGPVVVPPVRLRFPVKNGPEERLATEPARLVAELPPGAEGLATLISAPRFELLERWEPTPGAARVGDAFTRTLTLRADDVLAMGFPPLPLRAPDGVGLYAQPFEFADRTERGVLTGERVERWTYVCERAGEFELPALSIPWYDLAAGELKRERLPARRLEVAPAPELEGEAELAAEEADRSGPPWTVLVAALVALALALSLVRARRTLLGELQRAWRARQAAEPAAFRRFRRAARSGDAAATWRALYAWLQRAGHGGAPAQVERFVAGAGDEELRRLARELERSLFAAGASREAWTGGAELARAATSARRALLRPGRARSRARLGPLNPALPDAGER